MARLLDRIVVVDVESTCWEGDPPPGEQSEIIEIGLCTLDIASLEVADQESVLVTPTRSEVSEFCTSLTTLTADQVRGGTTFDQACDHLKRVHRTQGRLWASWGDYDRRQFERQCRETGVGYPFGPSHLNVKALFAAAYARPREVGMSQALEDLGLPLVGTHHRGVDDAYNISQILAVLLRAPRREVA